MNREQIQTQIDLILEEYPDVTLIELKEALGLWLDDFDLSYEGLEQEFVRNRILDDLASYKGVPLG